MRGSSVLLIEDSPLFRVALTSVLRRLGLSVTATNSSGLRTCQIRHPILVLFDLATYSQGLAELEETTEFCSRVAPVLLLGREDRLQEILVAVKAGAVGFIQQTASTKEIRSGVRAIASGRTHFDGTVFRRVMKCFSGIASPKETRMTKREGEVISQLILGRTNKEIAESLALSEQSIKVHVSNLFRKTGTCNRSSLVLFAVARGLGKE